MQKAAEAPRLADPGAYEKVFKDGESVLLTVRQKWPRLAGDGPGPRRINRYYDALADRWRRRWEGPLLEAAKAAAGPETPPWEARLDFTVTLFDGRLFSLHADAAEDTGRRHPLRVRQGDAWRLPGGAPVTLRELLPPRRWWRGPVLEEVRRQIGRQVSAGEAVYFEDWPRLASRQFSFRRFWLTAEGPVIFYPVGALAPELEGFPAFLLPAAPPGAAP